MNVDFDYIDPSLLEEDDRIIAYLKGKMTKDEETSFMQDLRNDPELKAKAITTARLVKGMKEIGAQQDKETKDVLLASTKDDVENAVESVKRRNRVLVRAEKEFARRKEMKSISSERELSSAALTPTASINDEDIIDNDNGRIPKTGTTLPTQGGRRKYTILKWMSAAASIIAIVWVGIGYYDYKKTTGLGDVYYESFTIVEHEFTKGPEASKEIEAKLKVLYDNVKNKEKLAQTIHELTLYWELSTMDVYNDFTDYSAEIGWCLAIAHLKDNNKKRARIVLEKLISTTGDGSAVNLKAKELLGKL